MGTNFPFDMMDDLNHDVHNSAFSFVAQPDTCKRNSAFVEIDSSNSPKNTEEKKYASQALMHTMGMEISKDESKPKNRKNVTIPFMRHQVSSSPSLLADVKKYCPYVWILHSNSNLCGHNC